MSPVHRKATSSTAAAAKPSAAAPPDAGEPPSRPSQPAIGRRKSAGDKGDKREAILAAALELFVERGFYGTAVPEIADRAAVGAGTIYRYFESKDALVNELYREHKLRFAQVALDNFPATAPTREQFRVLWMRMAKFAADHPSSFVFLELHHHARYLDARSHAIEQRITAMFRQVVVAAQARGELKPGDPRVLMGLVMGGFVGVIRGCVEDDRPPGEADWKLAEQCMWEAIRA
ncbi:MAG TPA: TetR/AcrR family transcriptional regulator [Kofleriaceae bacterium]|jgi:AcrR family transcriptional regulator|nr:TetR/AcrR family transcriptional regulator [Kofleriaceae bacterium]